MTPLSQQQIEILIKEDPKLHDWGKGPQSGGLGGDILRTLAGYLSEFGEGKFTSLETGAGLSTLVFAAAKPAKHFAVNPDAGLRARIFAEAERRGISMANVEYHEQFNEYLLPDLAKANVIDIALVDGGHGWPSVFVDFCYANMMLRQGGIMIVDDILLYPCTQLYMLLKHQPGWKLEKTLYSKTAFFRKEWDQKLLPDFGGQPYLKNNIILS